MNSNQKGIRTASFILIILLLSFGIACGFSIDTGAPKAAAATATIQPAAPAPTTAPATAEPVAAPTAEPTVEPQPEVPTALPLLMPGEPPQSERILEDADGSLRAEEKRTLSGDAILDNRYERPFTAKDMAYEPDVDIQTAEIAADDAFFYFTITLKGVDMGAGKLTAAYGIEFDRTQTGRGDLLVYASDPQPEWSTTNLNVYADKNLTVGGLKPMVAEAGMAGDGYETSVALEGDLAAFARVSPQNAYAVQIAVSRKLLDNSTEFLWGAWADKVIRDPSKFDYNDTFGPSEAGSPIKPSDDYPLKALPSLDNTCRLPFGITRTSGIPGMCLSIPKPVKSAGKQGQTCICTRWSVVAYPPVCLNWSCK
jgi:hypothetical protein